MKRPKTKMRNIATANPDLMVRYIDSGYDLDEWLAICEAMRRHDPDPKAPNVFPRRQGKDIAKPAVGKPSIASLLASRQIQEQIWASRGRVQT